MLAQLHIENIAVIEKASIDFGAGLNVLTGETGAGKSILIDSIQAILGSRTSKELIRYGAEKAKVSALFTDILSQTAEKLSEMGFEPDEDECLLIQREISRTGKGWIKVNGRPCTVAVLKEIGLLLINMHGQHENQALLSVEKHLEYLDSAGGIREQLKAYAECYEVMRRVYRDYQSVNLNEEEKERKLDLLRYQINEIEAADLHPEEYEELCRAHDFYANSEKIAEGTNSAAVLLSGENTVGAVEMVYSAAAALENIERFSPTLKETAARLHSLYYEIEDCAKQVHEYISEMEYDPYEQERVESRLIAIEKLSRKYGSTITEILEYLEKAQEELESIEFADEKKIQLEKKYAEKREEAEKLAASLTECRRLAGEELRTRICEELRFLGMEKVAFSVRMERTDLTANGGDMVEFLMSTNPGEDPKPISKIASGGELSRIMLAIKNVLAQNDDIETLIFDEVDTGISGTAARKVGRKLKDTAKCRQVICVTHLAQIAAFGDHHFYIEKNIHGGRTYTAVKELDFDGRKLEIARIMHGADVTQVALSGAEQLLNSCN